MCLEIKVIVLMIVIKEFEIYLLIKGNNLLSQTYSKFYSSWTCYNHTNWYEMGHEQEQREHCSYHHDI